ncbi:GNAT family N-acetyltransferase [Sphingomonas donggukensis]|uniref:GNAT family N-acetyltransferase n=1 Tax=Sphingomonas donggukensis TaxID=2949093 RepID=A0ABY4TQB5_9SPHN|nr:GNAT family N-acetyltransferase [Sphingomonas donggukensis]URW74570.1 GNAT family N-acetyltransferase [Sphingomonas donggukensis]
MIRAFASDDRTAMLAFAQGLPEHDLMFLGRDLRHPRVVDAWAAAISDGDIDSLLHEDEGRITGSAALVRDPLGWSGHVGEVRVLVATAARGQGVGRALLAAIIRTAQNHGLKKLTARMTPDQSAAIELFESQGFRGEALLKDHAIDRQGRLHDIAILSLDLEREAVRQTAFGMQDA